MDSGSLYPFFRALRSCSVFIKIGLVVLLFLTPNSHAVRSALIESIPGLQRLEKRVAITSCAIFLSFSIVSLWAIIGGPLTGFMAIVFALQVILCIGALSFIVNATINAESFVVMTYRHHDVYKSIQMASRDYNLYIGQLRPAGRLLSSLPGNVRRSLDGLRIIGAISDLIDLSKERDLADPPNGQFGQVHQHDELESMSLVLGRAYGVIAQSLWSRHPIFSLLSSLISGNGSWVTRSDSGSFLYEFFLRGKLSGVVIPQVLALPVIGYFNLTYAFYLSGFIIASIIWIVSTDASKTRPIDPESLLWRDFEQSLLPCLRMMLSSNTLCRQIGGRNVAIIQELINDVQNENPIPLEKIDALEPCIVRIARKSHNKSYLREALFFLSWEQENSLHIKSNILRDSIVSNPLDDNSSSRAGEALSISQTSKAFLDSDSKTDRSVSFQKADSDHYESQDTPSWDGISESDDSFIEAVSQPSEEIPDTKEEVGASDYSDRSERKETSEDPDSYSAGEQGLDNKHPTTGEERSSPPSEDMAISDHDYSRDGDASSLLSAIEEDSFIPDQPADEIDDDEKEGESDHIDDQLERMLKDQGVDLDSIEES